MKKEFVASFLFLFILFNASKASFIDKLHFGFTGYAGFAGIDDQNTYGHTELDAKFKLGFNFGGEVGFNFSQKFSFIAQLNHSHIGGKWMGNVSSGTQGIVNTEREISLVYTQLPLMIRYRTPGKTAFYIEAGLGIGSLQKAREKYSPSENLFDSAKPRPLIKEAVSEKYMNSALTILAGFGVDFKVSDNINLLFGTRLNSSVYNINNNEKDGNGKHLYRYGRAGKYITSRNHFAGVGIVLKYRFGKDDNMNNESETEKTVEENNSTEDETNTNESFEEIESDDSFGFEEETDTKESEILEDELNEVKEEIEKLKAETIVKPVEIPAIAPTSKSDVFKIQILTTNNILNLTNPKFKGLPKLNRYEHEGLYKYTTGIFDNYQDAKVFMKNTVVPLGFSDAFLVRFRNGERVPMNQVFE